MGWNRQHIDAVAEGSAPADYAAFEALGLDAWDDARILDVGCFDGYNTVLKFSPYGGIAEVRGIDPSEEAIGWASESTDDPRFRWEVADWASFEPDCAGFDLIYFGHTLQHLEDKPGALAKAFRLLAPGGWVVVKTVDDSAKISHPDPDRIMERLFELYEAEVRPRVAHTAHTDRRFGSACPSLLHAAGFVGIQAAITHANTAGLDADRRAQLFERLVYFRRALPEGLPAEVAARRDGLLESWGRLFRQPGYFFDSPTFTFWAQKPGADSPRLSPGLRGPWREASDAPWPAGCVIDNAREDDLGSIMVIETRSFADPWSPLAYALELRSNPDAAYGVLREDGRVIGYVGVWLRDSSAFITQVAVHPDCRRRGAGRALVESAALKAREAGARDLRLTVRQDDERAVAFYRSLGFQEVGRAPGYYGYPPQDGIVMGRSLEWGSDGKDGCHGC